MLDYEAAIAQLEECLLTPKEMAADKRRWLALNDPYADSHEQQQVERDLRLSDRRARRVSRHLCGDCLRLPARLVSAR